VAAAPVDLVRQHIANMALQYVQCRDWGHSWRPYSVTQERGDWHQELRCARCHTIRRWILDRYGHPTSKTYDYPDDYLAAPGTGRMSADDRDVLRLRSLQALLTADTTED